MENLYNDDIAGEVHIICVKQWSSHTVYYKTVYMF